MKTIVHWLKTNSVMLINASSVFGTTIVTSILGFAYWWVAARQLTPEAVGTGSAAISSMTLLGLFCVLGMGTVLITEIPRQPQKSLSLTSTALIVVSIAGGLAGLLFATIVPLFSHAFSYLNANIFDIFLFALGVSLTSFTWVLDQALIAHLRGSKQFHRNALFAGSKLVLLALMSFYFSNLTGMNIYATWTLGNIFSLIVTLLPIVLKSKKRFRHYLPDWKFLRQIGGAALQHHLINTTLQLTPYLLPLIVTILLSTKINALFYISWMIVSFIFSISIALTVVLHAMNPTNPYILAQKARTTMSLALVPSIVAALVLQFASQHILSLFGQSYLDGTWILRTLILAAFPLIIRDHYISICRIQDRFKHAMWILVPGWLLELALATLGARLGGLPGLSLGWVIATYVEALCIAPMIYKTVFAVKLSSMEITENLVGTGLAHVRTTGKRTWQAQSLQETLTSTTFETSELLTFKLANGGAEPHTETEQWIDSQFKPLRLPALPSSSLSQFKLLIIPTLPSPSIGQFNPEPFQSIASSSSGKFRTLHLPSLPSSSLSQFRLWRLHTLPSSSFSKFKPLRLPSLPSSSLSHAETLRHQNLQ